MGGGDAPNMGMWCFTRSLFDQKFISIFSMPNGAVPSVWQQALVAVVAGLQLIVSPW